MLSGLKGLIVGLFCLEWNLLPHTRQGWLAVAFSLPFIWHAQLLMLPNAEGLPRGMVLRWLVFNVIDLIDASAVLSWALVVGCAAMVA